MCLAVIQQHSSTIYSSLRPAHPSRPLSSCSKYMHTNRGHLWARRTRRGTQTRGRGGQTASLGSSSRDSMPHDTSIYRTAAGRRASSPPVSSENARTKRSQQTSKCSAIRGFADAVEVKLRPISLVTTSKLCSSGRVNSLLLLLLLLGRSATRNVCSLQ